MPDWGEVLAELQESAADNNGTPNFDAVRRKYLAGLRALTRRPVIIYYSDWLAGGSLAATMTLEDMQGFMQTVRGLAGRDLDLVLHLPGGSPEATARIVDYLRAKFNGQIRIFVPLAAMSAGTMLALAGDRVVMGNHSQLGPIDPQILSLRDYVGLAGAGGRCGGHVTRIPRAAWRDMAMLIRAIWYAWGTNRSRDQSEYS